MQNDAVESTPVIVNRICFFFPKAENSSLSSMSVIFVAGLMFSLLSWSKEAKNRFLGGAFFSTFTFVFVGACKQFQKEFASGYNFEVSIAGSCHDLIFPAIIPATFTLVYDFVACKCKLWSIEQVNVAAQLRVHLPQRVSPHDTFEGTCL